MEQSKEEIALKFGLCTCDEMYTKRNMTAPDCPWHATCVDEAMEEYANSKLHPLQQEYEHLQRWSQEATLVLEPILDYGQSHPDIKLGSSITTFVIERCKEYDKLKGEKADWLDIAGTASRKYNELWVQHHDLKEKADKMDATLTSIASSPIPSNDWENFSWIETARRLASEALSSYNSNTNQNENNG